MLIKELIKKNKKSVKSKINYLFTKSSSLKNLNDTFESRISKIESITELYFFAENACERKFLLDYARFFRKRDFEMIAETSLRAAWDDDISCHFFIALTNILTIEN